MARLTPKIDTEVLKLKDPKVRSLLSAKLSVEAFALLTRPGDPYVLVGDTIYALTEDEFYALQSLLPQSELSEKAFRHVMSMDDVSFMSNADAATVAGIKKALPNCPSCKYRKYRDQVLQLVKKYGIEIPTAVDDTQRVQPLRQYPETDGVIQSKVTGLLSHMYDVPALTRKPCMDCVEKHVSQAWVLANEARQGYPEYVSLVVGHLGEALNELPKELTAVAATLTYCLARTNYTRRPFVPAGLILPLLQAGRKELALDAVEPADDKMPAENSLMQLDLDETTLGELAGLPADVASYILGRCDATDKIIPRVENSGDLASLEWEGAMGEVADWLAQHVPTAANVLRARRLMFKDDPRLARQAGYALDDLKLALSHAINSDAGGGERQPDMLR